MRKYRYKILIALLLIVVILPAGITFSRYVYDFISYYILESNDFFFNSDKLGEQTIVYGVENWGGVGTFDIEFELNNHKNNLLTSVSDINYELNVTHSEDVQTSINYVNGTILTGEKTDSYTIVVTPTRVFDTGETVRINVVAKSTSPYVKTLSATFNITVGRKGISYEIIDKANQPYLELVITSARDNYKVNQAFGNYPVGHILSYNEYKALSAADKAKCTSAVITLTFNPSVIVLDTTSDIVHDMDYNETTVNSVDYVSTIEFPIEAMSSNKIRFYKANPVNNYTYPNGNATSIINFSSD